MSLVKRIWFAIRVNFALGLVAVLYFRIGVDYLYPMAIETFPGPFTTYAEGLQSIVPIAIAIPMLATWLWVIYGTVQEEKKRSVRVR